MIVIPYLNEHGLLPEGVHNCSVPEMTARFGWNEHRQGLLLSFEAFLRNEVRAVFDHPVYADGSFVTDKEHPEDIDVALDLLAATDADKWRGVEFMSERCRIRSRYGVDFWVNLPGGNDFSAFFQYAGHKMAKFKGLDHHHRKGILRLA